MAILWILNAALWAQSGVEGPTLGVIWDESAKAVRLVAGIPGSAVIGAKFDSPVAFRLAEASQDRALALSEEGGVYRLNRNVWTRLNLPAGALRLRLSAGGDAAAVTYADGVAWVMRPDGAAREVRLPAGDPPLAVDDAGALLLAATGRDLWVIHESGNRWKQEFDAEVLDVAFTGRPGTVVVGTAAGLWLLEGVEGAGSRRLLAEGEAAHVNVARSGRLAIFASPARLVATAVDIESGSTRQVETPVAPASLARLGAGDVFRITGGDAELTWMLDWRQEQPRALFLPRRAEGEE